MSKRFDAGKGKTEEGDGEGEQSSEYRSIPSVPVSGIRTVRHQGDAISERGQTKKGRATGEE